PKFPPRCPARSARRTAFPLPGVRQRDDLPSVRELRELEGVHAAVTELGAGVEVVFHPDGGEVLVDADFGVVGAFVPDHVTWPRHGLHESIRLLEAHAQGAVPGGADGAELGAGSKGRAEQGGVPRPHGIEEVGGNRQDGGGVRRRLGPGPAGDDDQGERGETGNETHGNLDQGLAFRTSALRDAAGRGFPAPPARALRFSPAPRFYRGTGMALFSYVAPAHLRAARPVLSPPTGSATPC